MVGDGWNGKVGGERNVIGSGVVVGRVVSGGWCGVWWSLVVDCDEWDG